MPGEVKLKPRPNGLDGRAAKVIIKVMSSAHRRVYLATGGRLGKKWHVGSALRNGVPVCMVTTTGRVSGQPRTVPLLYMRDAGPGGDAHDIVIVASQGGLPTDPQWYLNLQASPHLHIQIGRTKRAYVARTVHGPERARLWAELVELYADFASYQTWTDREIPVVACSPA